MDNVYAQISGIATGNWNSLGENVWRKVVDVQKTILVRDFSPLLYQKWIWVMLIQERRKFLFEKPCNMK